MNPYKISQKYCNSVTPVKRLKKLHLLLFILKLIEKVILNIFSELGILLLDTQNPDHLISISTVNTYDFYAEFYPNHNN